MTATDAIQPVTLSDASPAAGTVLVVDDLESNLDLLTRLLTAQGYRVITAPTARRGLDRRRAGAAGRHPVRHPHAEPRRVRRLSRGQGVAGDATDAGRADDRRDRSGRPHPGDRGRRQRLPDQADRSAGAQSARAIAHAAQALHRRSRFGRSRAAQPGADDRSARRLHRGPLRAAGALRDRSSASSSSCPRTTSRRSAAAATSTTSARSRFPTRSCSSPVRSRRTSSTADAANIR